MTQTATTDQVESKPLPQAVEPPPAGHPVLTVLMVPVPLVLPPSQQAIAIRVLILGLMSVGWNIMSRFQGPLLLPARAAYFGLGAYATAWLLVEKGGLPWIGLAVG